MKASDRLQLPEPCFARAGVILLLCGVCLVAGAPTSQAAITAPSPTQESGASQQSAASEKAGSTLETAAAKAGSTGRAVAMSLIGLAFAVAAIVLAFSATSRRPQAYSRSGSSACCWRPRPA